MYLLSCCAPSLQQRHNKTLSDPRGFRSINRLPKRSVGRRPAEPITSTTIVFYFRVPTGIALVRKEHLSLPKPLISVSNRIALRGGVYTNLLERDKADDLLILAKDNRFSSAHLCRFHRPDLGQ